jgi:hypothetical protein
MLDALIRPFVLVARDVLFSPLRLPLPLGAKLAIGTVIVRLDAPLRRYLAQRFSRGVSGS